MTVTRRPAFRRTMASKFVLAALFIAAPDASAAKPPKPTTTTTTRPRDTGAPTTPTNLRVTATTQTSVSLAWNPSTDNGPFSYVVRQNNSLSSTVPPSSGASYAITSLSPGREYSFFVYAVDQGLNVSGNSNTVTATTQPDLVPPSAPVLTVTNVSPSQIWLTWTESRDDLQWWSVGYRLSINGALATGVNWINQRDASLRHLTPSTTYTFQVAAVDGSGNAANSNTVSVTTQSSTDTVPPSAPTSVHIESDQGCAEVFVAWTQSADNVDPQFLIEYEIYINGVLSPWPWRRASADPSSPAPSPARTPLWSRPSTAPPTRRPRATPPPPSSGPADAQGGVEPRNFQQPYTYLRFMKVPAPLLAPILRSDVQGRVLARLFADPAKSYNLTELVEWAGSSMPTVQREVGRAEQAGIVTTKKVGPTRLVSANTQHPLFAPLSKIVAATYGPPAVIAREF
ncbi:MAG: fibronectin type III domain-containing protein [Acidimicrobiales bacterium]